MRRKASLRTQTYFRSVFVVVVCSVFFFSAFSYAAQCEPFKSSFLEIVDSLFHLKQRPYRPATHAIKVSSRFLTIQNVLTLEKKKVKAIQRSNDKRFESTFCII